MFFFFITNSESVQRTGVAIETQGFTLVTSGKKRESLLGNATLHLYPQLKSLAEIEDSIDYIGTEISTSKQKQFSLLTFIDTPGMDRFTTTKKKNKKTKS